MKTFRIALVVGLASLAFSGCRIARNIEQWKCDNLGMCHFGITPSNQGDMGCSCPTCTTTDAYSLPESEHYEQSAPAYDLPAPEVSKNSPFSQTSSKKSGAFLSLPKTGKLFSSPKR